MRGNLLDRLNHIVNQPEVRCHIAPGDNRLDMTPYITSRNVVLIDDDGAALFEYVAPGVYLGHYLYTAARRGKAAKEFSLSAMSMMFDVIGASAILGQVAEDNLACRHMSRAIGCTPRGRSVDIYGRSCIDYVLERRSWEALSADSSRALAA